MDLQLTAEERELLAHILQEKHRELLKEIFHTDHHEFKRLLREREKVLEGILTKLGVSERVVA